MSGFDYGGRYDLEEEEKLEGDSATPQPIISREQIELSTIDEDPAAIANIGLALQRAGTDFTGVENLTRRAEDIQRVRERVGGEEVLS